jgi:hypothetical protein
VDGRTDALRRVTLLSPLVCAGSCLTVLCVCWFAIEPVLSGFQVRAASTEDVRAFLVILGAQTIIRNSAAGYAMYVASSGSSRQMAAPLLIEIALALTIAMPLGWLYGESALLYGLITASLIGSLFTSKVMTMLGERQRIGAGWSFLSLLGAQAGVTALWWLMVTVSS